ncbi:glycosyltransferase family 2 protein [Thalassobellus citreus]|uniref:glycosyltransferase family 2 protein n=1 Tax=Thalassobellus citreus TaxID=3367752 RepID=UPI0037AAE3EE
MILASIIITIFYLILIGSFAVGFDKVSVFKLEDLPSKTKFSVIIPFRNEAEHLPELLKSIKTLNYPKHLFEIIFVDDTSEDDSVKLIEHFIKTTRTTISIIQNERKTNSPKKDAITSAINKAKNEWIITTDADCVLPKYWLDSFDEYIQKTSTKCIAAPVTYLSTNSFLNRFQLLDLLSLQGATIGGFGLKKPFLCNGANFGYQKALFKTLNGFDGNSNIASGDDIFLLEKVAKKHPKALHYLKCEQAIVSTEPQTSWKHLISQRLRWAAKTSAYNNWFSKLTGLIVLAMNALIITSVLLTIIGSFNFKILLYFLFIKLNIDFFLIYKSATFFNQKEILRSFVFGFLLYPFFSVYIVFLSTFSNYKWKGRTFKK